MSFEMVWNIIAGVLCITLAYFWGIHVGCKRTLDDINDILDEIKEDKVGQK